MRSCLCLVIYLSKSTRNTLPLTHSHTLQHTHTHQEEPGMHPSALCLDSSPVTPHQCLCFTTIRAPLPDRALCSAVPCQSTLLGFKLHWLNVERGSCNTLWRQVALWLFWSKSTWLAVYHIPRTGRSSLTIPSRGKQ